MNKDVGNVEIEKNALGRILENIGILVKTGVYILKVYMEFVIIGATIFLLFYFSILLGVKANLLKSKSTLLDIEITKLLTSIDEVNLKIKSFESKARVIYEFEKDGKKYRILRYEKERK